MGMLDEGVTMMGAVHRVFDKYGKRLFVSSVSKDTSKKDATHASRSAVPSSAVSSNETRTTNGTK